MLRFVILFVLVSLVAGQESGRDGGAERPVLFVRWRKSTESGEVYRAAWRALERFRGIQRRRLIDFHQDEKRATERLAQHADASVVVAFGVRAAAITRKRLPKARVVEVSPREGATVRVVVDRERLARIVRRFAPDAQRIACLADEKLPGWKNDRKPAANALTWVSEFATTDAPAGRVVVSTNAQRTRATLFVRPAARSSGLLAAAAVRRWLRGKKPAPARARRVQVTIDLDAAHRYGHRVPLDMLARADAVLGAS